MELYTEIFLKLNQSLNRQETLLKQIQTDLATNNSIANKLTQEVQEIRKEMNSMQFKATYSGDIRPIEKKMKTNLQKKNKQQTVKRKIQQTEANKRTKFQMHPAAKDRQGESSAGRATVDQFAENRCEHDSFSYVRNLDDSIKDSMDCKIESLPSPLANPKFYGSLQQLSNFTKQEEIEAKKVTVSSSSKNIINYTSKSDDFVCTTKKNTSDIKSKLSETSSSANRQSSSSSFQNLEKYVASGFEKQKDIIDLTSTFRSHKPPDYKTLFIAAKGKKVLLNSAKISNEQSSAKPHKCSLCGKSYKFSKVLQNHIIAHIEEGDISLNEVVKLLFT